MQNCNPDNTFYSVAHACVIPLDDETYLSVFTSEELKYNNRIHKSEKEAEEYIRFILPQSNILFEGSVPNPEHKKEKTNNKIYWKRFMNNKKYFIKPFDSIWNPDLYNFDSSHPFKSSMKLVFRDPAYLTLLFITIILFIIVLVLYT
jgi:hypothetical protein